LRLQFSDTPNNLAWFLVRVIRSPRESDDARRFLTQYAGQHGSTMVIDADARTMVSDQLRDLTTIEDLSQLFATLHYTPDNRPYGAHARVVARWRSFRIVAASGTDASETARKLARALSADGCRALAVGLSPRHEIALAAPRLGASGTSRVLSIPLRRPSADALQHLARFAPHPDSNGLRHTLRVTELLASEIVSERFFVRFREIHSRMILSLEPTLPETDRSMIALLALTRVLFLYFVQAKGWLDGRFDYLRRHLDAHLSANTPFHRCFLNPLFFDVLNRPVTDRTRPGPFGRVPYLNGGLFERHSAELRHRGTTFDNDLWREAFDSLFERFRFCIREADQVDAIAPDMLGHVFERVMADQSRRASGTYYTPEGVVRELVRATLATALTSGRYALQADVVSALMKQQTLPKAERRRAHRAVRSLRVLDPAVGSGAFLLGVLELLYTMYVSLDSRHTSLRSQVRARKRIIRTQLFGIDINPIAVRLAELRLWLAVIANDPETQIERIEPLPNLDGVVRQGDALIDPVSAAHAVGTHAANVSSELFKAVRVNREAVFAARSHNRSDALRRLRLAEQHLATALLEASLDNTNKMILDILSAARGRDLFGRRRGLSHEQARFHDLLRQHRRAIRRALVDVHEGVIPFFAFEVHLPDVIRVGGFTAIVGNPPWVRAERLPSATRRIFKDRFSWWSASPARGFAHLPDLSIVFLQRALELAAPNGAVGLLLPSKVATAAYGQHARAHMVSECTIEYARRIPDRDAAQFRATTYPLALVLRKQNPPDSHQVRLDFDGLRTVDQRSLSVNGPWMLLSSRVRDALATLCAAGPSLGQTAPAALGVKTGANRVFVGKIVSSAGDAVTLLVGDSTLELMWRDVRRAIRGADVCAFGARPRRILLWGCDAAGTPQFRLSSELEHHFQRHRRQLLARSDYAGGPLWTLFRVRAGTASHRVVWPDIVRRPCAAVVEESEYPDAIPLNSCYVSAAPDRTTALVISTVLNTTWMLALLTARGDEARGGYRRCNARVADAIPVPQQGRDELARMGLEAHHGRVPRQQDLDDAVADALALSSTTRQVLRAYCHRDCR
jgi:Eco57I restriction-modification methylase